MPGWAKKADMERVTLARLIREGPPALALRAGRKKARSEFGLLELVVEAGTQPKPNF